MGLDELINQWMQPVTDAVAGFIFYAVPIAGADVPLIVAWLIAGGVFFTLYLRFINVRGFKHALDLVRGATPTPPSRARSPPSRRSRPPCRARLESGTSRGWPWRFPWAGRAPRSGSSSPACWG